ncbi:hypothetical protein FNV43_RR10545 [Rhamnella rubrinervis]|uniref:AAA+ ATPase domain-containing protein n=1 Tax=Rhamnella rubrinervis TaxID=2594499 RepID=A0A8K0MGF2_9ROSA|nr:hypothetical protein FNV43_RR10545 [Rhamnella rubrinervis]
MEIITSIGSKIGELLVEPVGRQLAYLIFYQDNIAALVDETKKLKDQRDGIQLLVDAATRNSEVILPEVISWVRKVDDEITNVLERFLEEEVNANKMCLNGLFPNLKLRHSLGRKAKKYAEVVLKLQQERKSDRISSPPPPTGMPLSTSMKPFQSRTEILNQVMEALRDKNMHIIAICGMGGIGKTTMAKEVARRAKEEKLFEVVVMAVVSQNPSVMKIQGEIADMLRLLLAAEYTTGRADQLSNGIKKISKILIILDDIWDRLDLDAVGIPCGSQHPGCSILLTSRNVEACSQMRSQGNFTIEVLSDGEAWNLFEEAAGTSINTRDLYPIAKQIANECRGLPVAIVTVGRALENKGKDEWNDALHQLRKSIAENISGMDAYVYSSIELSYKFLRSKQAKSCFLLCCLFPEDYDIPIETLVRYGKGLRIFQDTDTMEETRNRVHSLVQTLKRCFLLVDSNKEFKEEYVKMHDVVRDVALSIASKKEHGFVVRCADIIDAWPEIDRREDCTTISLVADQIKTRLDNLRCPNLKLLHLSANRILKLEKNFRDEMKEIKVLALRNMRVRSPPSSLRVLQNMRTLHLEFCVLANISPIGALVNLEVLSLHGSELEELPGEIGCLQHLKLLDITSCWLNGILPGVLSSLTRLEELYMRDTYLRQKDHEFSASLAELICLDDHLKVLDFGPQELQLLPKNFVFQNLTRFRISICASMTNDLNLPHLGDGPLRCFTHQNYFSGNQLNIMGDMDAFKETGFEIHPLLEKCETLLLIFVDKLNNAWMDEVGFSRLKDLHLIACAGVEYLVYTNSNLSGELPFSLLENLKLEHTTLKALCHPDFLQEAATRQMQLESDIVVELQLFHNLKLLHLGPCAEINCAFSTSLANGSFPQLQRLSVNYCPKMEGIVYKETGENGQDIADMKTIVFPKLTVLQLHNLHVLTSLYRAMDDNNSVQLCPSRNDIHMTPKVPESPNVLVPFKILKWLPSLEILSLDSCREVRVVLDFHGLMVMPLPEKEKTNNSELIGGEDKDDDHFHGIDYQYWCLQCLPPLARKHKSVKGNNNNTALKKSQDDQIITTSSHSDSQGEVSDHRATEQVLYNLKDLQVYRCESVTVIFNFGEGHGSFPPVLNKLRNLELINLDELIHIWNIKNCPQQVITSSFQNLTSLQISSCPRLRYLFPPSIAKLLMALESIDIRGCESMQVIVARKEEDENVNDVLVLSFLHLRSISLLEMKNLSCFSDQPNCAIRFPSLENVKISGCPMLKTFVTAAATSVEDTPKLKQVEDSDLPQPQLSKWLGDLNTTIQHNFQLKQRNALFLGSLAEGYISYVGECNPPSAV